MKYKFDGYDAILNEDDDLIYDGLDSRSADIIIRQMESLDLCEAKIAALEAELAQQKESYRIVAKNLMTYQKMKFAAQQDDQKNESA